ncbi:hypothetical protein [Thermoanaerobacter thermocopriae]|nr:hypothetical protein [Thermoanaerobacter thermocopriae]
MKIGYMTNAWGSVVGHPAGVTSVKDLFIYLLDLQKKQLSQFQKLDMK